MRAMILAAGLGKRLRPLTNDVPKPMMLVGGKPLLQWHIERLVGAGIKEIVINTSWLADKIEGYFKNGAEFGAKIIWSRETTPLETGGGIYKALPLLGKDPFIVINADIWSDFSIDQLAINNMTSDILAYLVLVRNPEHNRDGDFSLTNEVIGYNENRYTFSGISLISPALFNPKNIVDPVFSLPSILSPAILSQKVGGSIFLGDWCDVGTLTRYYSLNRRLIERKNAPT